MQRFSLAQRALAKGGAPIPVTPYHFGPGLLVKAMLPRCFSFVAFAAANVCIDFEVLLHFLRRSAPLHRHCHTYLVAAGLGLVAGLLTFAASPWAHGSLPAWCRASRMWIPARGARLLGICLLSGLLGGSSHVLFDSLMHPEIRPLWPFSEAGCLFGLVTLPGLHLGCVAAGVLGATLWLAMECRRPGPAEPH